MSTKGLAYEHLLCSGRAIVPRVSLVWDWAGRALLCFLLVTLFPYVKAGASADGSGAENDSGPAELDPNAFAFDMLAALGEERADENFVFSPFSILTAFGMTYAGARSGTAEEMEKVFGFPGPADTHPALGDLAAALGESAYGENMKLRLANRIWIQEDWPVEEEFSGILDEHYQAPPDAADFRGQPEAERLRINQWVYDTTLERIEDLLPAGTLNELTRFVLVNALYFRAPWEKQFDPDATVDAPFHISPDDTVTVRMMYQEISDIPYIERELGQAVALPVEDGDFSFVIALPASGQDLADLREAVVSGEFLLDYEEWGQPAHVDLFLPRFRVEAEVELKDFLEGLGMADAFDPGAADFTGLYTGPEPELHLTVAQHKAFLEVVEGGLEAAAATAVGGGVTSVPPQFRADRPFLFFLVEDTTGAIVFAGQVNEPAAPTGDYGPAASEPESFEDWQRKHFSETQLEEPDISGPRATPGGDNVENLVKFFLGLDPHRPAPRDLPVPELRAVEVDGEEAVYLTYELTRPANREGVGHLVLFSSDLKEWGIQGVLVESIENRDGSVTEIWRDAVPANESDARFARLRVMEETEE